LYIGYARQDRPITQSEGDGKYYLSLRPGEFVTAVRADNTAGLRSAYDKVRIRRSIEYPVTGVAVALRRQGDVLADLRVSFTGTNPRRVLLKGTAELCGGPLEGRVFDGLDALVRDQIMSMKTTFTPGHYRRRVAGVLARRLVARLFAGRPVGLEAGTKLPHPGRNPGPCTLLPASASVPIPPNYRGMWCNRRD